MVVLITGGAGFIGSHITDHLIDDGLEVVIIDNLSSGKINNLNNKAKFYQIDINDLSALEKVFDENKIDYVIHLAAQASVSKSMNNPAFDAQENIIATINLLELCKKNKIKKFLAASTAAVYGNPEYLPVDEKHPANFISFYGLSKHTMENYIKLSGLNYIIFRLSNVYGPRQDSHGEAGVVSIFIDSVVSNNKIKIYGDGEQTRDFVYVKDIANAFLLAIKTDITNEVVNVSSNSSVSINSLLFMLKKIVKSDLLHEYLNEKPGDIKHSILGNNKAQSLFKWQARTTFEQGLVETLTWKKENLTSKLDN